MSSLQERKEALKQKLRNGSLSVSQQPISAEIEFNLQQRKEALKQKLKSGQLNTAAMLEKADFSTPQSMIEEQHGSIRQAPKTLGEKAFDVLQFGANIPATAIRTQQELVESTNLHPFIVGEGNPLEPIKTLVQDPFRNVPQDVVTEFSRGRQLKEDEQLTGGEVAGGVVAGAVLDPLTWAGPGLIKNGAKLMKGALGAKGVLPQSLAKLWGIAGAGGTLGAVTPKALATAYAELNPLNILAPKRALKLLGPKYFPKKEMAEAASEWLIRSHVNNEIYSLGLVLDSAEAAGESGAKIQELQRLYSIAKMRLETFNKYKPPRKFLEKLGKPIPITSSLQKAIGAFERKVASLGTQEIPGAYADAKILSDDLNRIKRMAGEITPSELDSFLGRLGKLQKTYVSGQPRQMAKELDRSYAQLYSELIGALEKSSPDFAKMRGKVGALMSLDDPKGGKLFQGFRWAIAGTGAYNIGAGIVNQNDAQLKSGLTLLIARSPTTYRAGLAAAKIPAMAVDELSDFLLSHPREAQIMYQTLLQAGHIQRGLRPLVGEQEVGPSASYVKPVPQPLPEPPSEDDLLNMRFGTQSIVGGKVSDPHEKDHISKQLDELPLSKTERILQKSKLNKTGEIPKSLLQE